MRSRVAARGARQQASQPFACFRAQVGSFGTALNGMTFSGDVLGPVDVSGAYRIFGPNTIRF